VSWDDLAERARRRARMCGACLRLLREALMVGDVVTRPLSRQNRHERHEIQAAARHREATA
jgi:hypothetical protein